MIETILAFALVTSNETLPERPSSPTPIEQKDPPPSAPTPEQLEDFIRSDDGDKSFTECQEPQGDDYLVCTSPSNSN